MTSVAAAHITLTPRAARMLKAAERDANPPAPPPLPLRYRARLEQRLDDAVQLGARDAQQWLVDHPAASPVEFADRLPSLLRPVPGPQEQAAELETLRELKAVRHPAGDAIAKWQAEDGAHDFFRHALTEWQQRVPAEQAKQGARVFEGAMRLNARATDAAKYRFRRQRPFEVDPSLPLWEPGKPPYNPAYPSGHTSGAFAGAAVLSRLWPERSGEFRAMAYDMAYARNYAGVHWPSDVVEGARLGTAIATAVAARPPSEHQLDAWYRVAAEKAQERALARQ